MANSHVLRLTPSSDLRKSSFTVDAVDNLPDRCESIAQSVIDDLKIISDAIDSIARVWFRVWHRYLKWKIE